MTQPAPTQKGKAMIRLTAICGVLLVPVVPPLHAAPFTLITESGVPIHNSEDSVFVNHSAEHGHSMSHGRVAWKDDVQRSWLYADGRLSELTHVHEPVITGTSLFWGGPSGVHRSPLADGPAAEGSPIAPGVHVYDRITADDNVAAWIGFEGDGAVSGIYVHDGFETRRVAPITGYDYRGVDTTSTRTVFTTPAGLTLYDIPSRTLQPLGIAGDQPVISGDYLAYRSAPGPDFSNQIILLNLQTGQSRTLAATPASHYFSPAIDGNFVAWIDASSQIFLHDIAGDATTPLPYSGSQVLLSGPYLSWGDGQDIYLTVIPEPTLLPLLSAGWLLLVSRRRRLTPAASGSK